MRAFFIVYPSLSSYFIFLLPFSFFPALPQIPLQELEGELASSLGACFHNSAAICFSLSVLTLIRTQPWLLCKLQLLQVTVPIPNSYPLSFISASRPPNLPNRHQLSYQLCQNPHCLVLLRTLPLPEWVDVKATTLSFVKNIQDKAAEGLSATPFSDYAWIQNC